MNKNRCPLFLKLRLRLSEAQKELSAKHAAQSSQLFLNRSWFKKITGEDDSCCTLLFIFFLCFCCNDANMLVKDLRKIILRLEDTDSRL